jgi:hypothetical protein
MNTKPIPAWILIYATLLALLGLFAGLAGFIAPEATFSSVVKADFGAIRLITGLYAGRSIAMGVVVGFAVLKKDANYLFFAFLMRLLTEIMDTIIMVGAGSFGMSPLVLISAMTVVFLVPEILALVTLSRLQRR